MQCGWGQKGVGIGGDCALLSLPHTDAPGGWPKGPSLYTSRMEAYLIPGKDVQLRVHAPYEQVYEALMQGDYIQRSAKVLMFEHDADEEVNRTHCHIYFFGLPLKRPDDALRDYFKALQYKKDDYFASTKCKKGARDLTPQGAYTYGAKAQALVPKFTKGFNDEQIASMAQEAKRFYEPKHEKVLIIHETEVKTDNVWEYFYAKMLRTPDTREYSQMQFMKWIMADYLSRCKPIPRRADLQRYGYSLWMLRNKRGPDDEVTMEEISDLYV